LLIFTLMVKSCIFSLAIPYGGNFYPHLENLEGYQDFRLAYVPLVSNFTAGKMPYRDFTYAYPPLFLYLLTPFSLASLPSWTMALPLVTFDVASVILVYLITRKFLSSSEALLASVTFALAPINLWYNDFLWLNPPPMTFFVLLAIYVFLSKRYAGSFLCLAIATLFKQIAVILFPVFLVALLKRSNGREVIKGAALYCAVCFLGSLPYIVTVPAYYFWYLGVPGFGSGWQGKFTYYFGSPTNLAIVLGEDAYDPAKPFLWLALLVSLAVLCWRIYRTEETDNRELISYVYYALLFFHAFFPRGIYKYYYAAVTPFSVMSARSRRGVLVFLGLNTLILVVPRFLTPWFSFFLLVMLWKENPLSRYISGQARRRLLKAE